MNTDTPNADRLRLARRDLEIADLSHDCLILAMAVYQIPHCRLPVETLRVLNKWRERVESELGIEQPSRDPYDREPSDDQMERVRRMA
jgi:hypothetical protein